jgi:endo-1,4-beta-xylanase
MLRVRVLALTWLALLVYQPGGWLRTREAMSQGATMPTTAPAAAALEVPLWASEAPGSEGWPNQETIKDGLVLHTFRPVLYVYLPAPEKATGDAVVICPGGGYNVLEIDKEGTRIAENLRAAGIASIVLKYRIKRFDQPDTTVEARALADAQRALRIVRANAAAWHIDALRIGIGGFSAGANLAAHAAAHGDAGQPGAADAIDRQPSRPSFVFLAYGYVEGYGWIDAQTPSFFMVHAADDMMVPVRQSLDLYQALLAKKVDSELHIFPTGGHGFGLGSAGNGTAQWMGLLKTWISTHRYEHVTTRPAGTAGK